jgi:1,4-alpha-glucan branching enzyme
MPVNAALERLVEGRNDDPFALLGPHPSPSGPDAVVVRVFQPLARTIHVEFDGAAIAMERSHPEGVFEADIERPGGMDGFDYRVRVTFPTGRVHRYDDPYRYGRILTDFDLHLMREGRHYRTFEKLGAHRRVVGFTTGVHFAVWAPNAERVSLVGDFNGWDARVQPMRRLLPNGIWEIFVPDVPDGHKYKFDILTAEGHSVQKADPHAVFFEGAPGTASVVWSLDRHVWQDEAWMATRAQQGAWLARPMSIYEVHVGSWRRVPEEGNRPLTYRELAETLVPYVKDMGYTHVELLPVMEHPFAGSWGYQVVGFFAPTSRFGSPEDFMFFVDECHRHGIGVLIDWVPGHFPADEHALARFDGTALYEHADPRQGVHRDWGTLIFNYGRHEVRNFLIGSALFWLERYHVDGLRVDAVASMLYLDYSREAGQWVPNRYGGRENLEAIEFLRELNTLAQGEFPGTIVVAEESTAWPAVSKPTYVGGLGFTFKWNMGWMHDMLEYMKKDPVHRKWAHTNITFSMLYAYTENFILPFSHDEVVHGKGSMIEKMAGDRWQRAATLRALYGFMAGHPGKKLLFMGSEFGQEREWNHDISLDWHLLDEERHAGIRRWVRDLNRFYAGASSLYEADYEPSGFQWIDCHDADQSIVSFVRRAADPADLTVWILNFTPVPRHGYHLGVPRAGRYVERLNSDSAYYGGSGLGNAGAVTSEPRAAHGRDHSLALVLPPLACVVFEPER